MDYKKIIKFTVPSIKTLQKIKDNSSKIKQKITKKLLNKYNSELERLNSIKIDIDHCKLENDKNKLLLLQKEIETAENKKNIEYFVDGLKGYRSNLRAKLKVAKENIHKEKKLKEIKKNINSKIVDLSSEFVEINTSINNLKIQSNSVNLPTFIAFSFSVECDYKFVAKKTEIERWTEYEERTRQVAYRKDVEDSINLPTASGNMTTWRYTKPVTSYRNEDYSIPVSKSRKVILREVEYECKLDASEMSSTTRFVACSTTFKNWESYINSSLKLNFENSEETLKKYSELINSNLFDQEETSIKIKHIEKNISFESTFQNLLETDIKQDLEKKLDNKVNSEIESFIKSSSEFNEFSDVSITYKVIENSKSNLCIPFLSHKLNFYSEKWEEELLIEATALFLKEEKEEYIDNSHECYEKIWKRINEKINIAEKTLKDAQQTSRPIKEPINFRPVLVILTSILIIYPLILEGTKRIENANTCWNEFEKIIVYNTQAKKYYRKSKPSEKCKSYFSRYMLKKYGEKNY